MTGWVPLACLPLTLAAGCLNPLRFAAWPAPPTILGLLPGLLPSPSWAAMAGRAPLFRGVRFAAWPAPPTILGSYGWLGSPSMPAPHLGGRLPQSREVGCLASSPHHPGLAALPRGVPAPLLGVRLPHSCEVALLLSWAAALLSGFWQKQAKG